MDQLPRREALEQTHHFPGVYTFKAIGRTERGFAERVVAAVREELSIAADPPFSIRMTQGGRHVSVTVEPFVTGAEEVITIYSRIRLVDGLVLML